jgi:AcrR family transcriptional regulator
MSPQPDRAGTARRQGRRPGTNSTRQIILDAARSRFSSDGYTGATIRKIAGDAGVDASLVMQFFGSKEQLFAAVLSIAPVALSTMADAFEGPAVSLGERVTRAFLQVWEGNPEHSEPLLAMLRSAIGNEQGEAQLREYIQARLTQALGPRLSNQHEAALRAGIAASMLVGIVVGRRIVRVPALVQEDTESLIARIAPAIQAVLQDDAGPGTAGKTSG